MADAQPTPPQDIAYAVSPAASYVVSLAAGYATRWRLRHRHAPPAAQPPHQTP